MKLRSTLSRLLVIGALSVGAAQSALAECWQDQGAVVCRVCGQSSCCITVFQNGQPVGGPVCWEF